MYIPPAFREDRLDVLHEAIRCHPLGLLICSGPEGLSANPLPFLLKEGDGGVILQAHMSRANDQIEALLDAHEVLVVFQGPQAYVSPSWYPSKAEHGKVVPTWNYVIVQVRGRPVLHADGDWLRTHGEALTATHEKDRAEPWRVDDAPEAYIAAQLRGIVGIEIPISHIEGKWKLSQNRNEADRKGVAEGYRREGDERMAGLIDLA